ncbi:MAG: hypothetical protein AB1714_25960 [Acidobacteriota bacterium]
MLELLFSSRVTVVVGHFGSGKTEIAINGAVELAGHQRSVTLVDLDVVKPYFRSRSARAFIAERGVDLIAPTGESYYADLPIILPHIRTVLRDPQRKVILDAGGDDTGARALGSLSDAVPLDETQRLLVLNFRRPFTESVEDAVVALREIEGAARMSMTGLVSNTHLMDETTADVVIEGYRLAMAMAKQVEVPVLAVTVEEGRELDLPAGEFDCPVFLIRRTIMPLFERPRYERKVGPIFELT